MAPADTENYRKYSAVARGIDKRLKNPVDYVVILTNSGDYSFVIVDASGGREAGDEGLQTENADPGGTDAEEGRQIEAPAGTQSASAGESPAVEEDGVYTKASDVALYLHLYGHLPGNFITKKEARALGWEGGGLEPYAPGKCIGGDRFGNYDGNLPEDAVYHECDIDTLGVGSRGAKRIVYAEDGSIYYTEDHYETFTRLY
ncbi:MAG: ribonuclease [Lachnospiraceae bacterium]|nr:ribonuclease [Lachnospiraceae bacterium]